MLDTLRQEIDNSISDFLTHIEKEYRLHLINPILYNSIREFSLRKGKRIRPLLLILAYLGYSQKKNIPPSLFKTSTCIEFLHNFMLIHDDIIDCSDLRRGKPTMHRLLSKTIRCQDPEKLGTDLAIIAGDIVYALAIDAFLSIDEDPLRKERALKYFVQTAAFTAMGEFIDTIHGVDKIENIQEDDVFLNYSLKTARYTFDCPLVTGAILAGAPEQEIELLSELGLLVGQAFQIQDDVIGIFETEKNIGKSILSDLAEEKKTLLVAHAHSRLQGAERKAFLKIFLKPRKTISDLRLVRKIFISSGSLEYALKAVRARVIKADAIIKRLTMRDKYRNLIHESLLKLFQQSQKVAEQNSVPIRFF